MAEQAARLDEAGVLDGLRPIAPAPGPRDSSSHTGPEPRSGSGFAGSDT